MKVLWFSHISMSNLIDGKYYYPGGSWVSSLRNLICGDEKIELAVVYWGNENTKHYDEYNTVYYQLKKQKSNKLNNYINNWKHKIENKYEIEKLLTPVIDFKPDIIQVFGTEGIYAQISKQTEIPVVIHVQGLIMPCIHSWNIPGLTNWKLFKSLDFALFLKGHGFYHDFFRMKKMAKREFDILTNNKFFLGRTDWDKSIVGMYAPNAMYMHCDEVIRDGFFANKWKPTNNKKFIISSTINANIYKGLDLILKTAHLLKNIYSLEFEWNIYGIRANSEYARLIKSITKLDYYENNVFLKGVASESKLVENLLNTDVFVHSSYIDNSPNSVCEAQLLGMPIVSTNVGGISTLIQHNIDGILVPTNEPHIMAVKINELLNSNKLQKYLGENARISALKRHDKTIIRDRLISIYIKVISLNK